MMPRIAILSMTNISCSNATGSLLARLFKNWQPSEVIQVCKYHHKDEIADQYATIIPFYDFLEEWRVSKNWIKRLPAVVLRRLLFPLLFWVGNKKEVLKKLREFKPEVLYLRVVGQPFYYFKLTLFLKQQLNVPLVLHFMDDYDLHLQIEGKSNPIKSVQSKLYTHFLKRVIALSDKNFAISESMASAFQMRYDTSFQVAHNGIEEADFQHFQQTQYPKHNPPRIVWAGAIELSKDNQIVKKIAQAIENINQDYPCQFFLNVPNSFVESAQKLAQKYACINYQTYQPLAAYKKLLGSASLLVIARNFDAKTKAYTQFSFHNKLPDFLSSGTPVLAIGADWDNTVQLFKKYGFGQVVSENNIASIEHQIKTMLLNQKNSLPKGEESLKVLEMEKIRRNFEETIIRNAKKINADS